ncbi:hypothetical protein GCM10010306_060680 [Streptomyces umbrinus]|nr:hypothetical protein GCM10010306_060680 [Streptomyces umbrinus]
MAADLAHTGRAGAVGQQGHERLGDLQEDLPGLLGHVADLDRITVAVRDLLDGLPPRHRKLTTENIIWAAVLNQRGLSTSLIAYLFRGGENQARALIKQVRPLLEDLVHRPEPIPARLIDPSNLAGYVMRATSTTNDRDTPHKFIGPRCLAHTQPRRLASTPAWKRDLAFSAISAS